MEDVKFYTIKQFAELSGWSIPTVQKLFNSEGFPSCDYGKEKIVEAEALRTYFSVPRKKSEMT